MKNTAYLFLIKIPYYIYFITQLNIKTFNISILYSTLAVHLFFIRVLFKYKNIEVIFRKCNIRRFCKINKLVMKRKGYNYTKRNYTLFFIANAFSPRVKTIRLIEKIAMLP